MPNQHELHDKSIAPVIELVLATSLYEEGVRRLRRPKPRKAPNGLDVNSYHFRGLRAAWAVMDALPKDEEDKRIPAGPEDIKSHMDLGLTAIRGVGKRPLAVNFATAYAGWTDVMVREATSSTEPSAQLPEPKSPTK